MLTAGFVVSGGNTRRLLIRAVGPGLAPLGIAGTVSDPEATLYSGPNVIAQNLGWNHDTTLAQTFTAVGAFALPQNSADAALVTTLAPGAYTIQASSRSGAAGIALVEVYEVP